MTYIQKTGSFLEIDENGYIVNTASKEHIQEKWKPAVEEIVEKTKEQYGGDLHSVYLRGSVAKGEAIESISDIDTYIVVDLPNEDIDRSWATPFKKDLIKKYPFVSDVELIITPLAGLEDRKGQKIMIKTQSVCLYGEDLAKQLASIKPGISSEQHARHIERDIDETKKELQKDLEDWEIKRECTWIMKRILRTGCELVMGRSGKYTRDLYPCYEVFVQYYPEKSDEMWRVLELAIEPIDDTKEIVTLLDSLGPWIVEEVANIFGEV